MDLKQNTAFCFAFYSNNLKKKIKGTNTMVHFVRVNTVHFNMLLFMKIIIASNQVFRGFNYKV